jgi:hypothetical protein
MQNIFEELANTLKELSTKTQDEMVQDLELIASEFTVINKFISAKFKFDLIEYYFFTKNIPVTSAVKNTRVKFHQEYEQLQIQAGKREAHDILVLPDVNDMDQYASFVVQKEKEFALKLMSLDPAPQLKNPVIVAKEAALGLEIRNMYGSIFIQNTETENIESQQQELINESSKIMLGPFIYLAAIKRSIGDVPGSTTLKAYCREYCKWMGKKLPVDILEYFFTFNPQLNDEKIRAEYKNYYRTFIPKRDKERGWGEELDSYKIFRTRNKF